MKKIPTILSVFVCCTLLSPIISCKKNSYLDKPALTTFKYTKSIDEIDLKIVFNFKRSNSDAFSIKLSENFSLEQKSSLYNTDQNVEYFTLRCKRADGTNYYVNGTVDIADNITVSFKQVASITY